MRKGERALDLLTRVQVATRRAELVAIAPGALGGPVGKIHPAVVPSSGIGVFFGALNSFKLTATIRQILSKVYGLLRAHLLSFNTWNP